MTISNLDHERAFDRRIFGACSAYESDRVAISGGRVHAGRLELHRAAEAEMARAGANYESALDAILMQARLGTVTLTAEALAGTGMEPASGTGRNGLRRDPVTGEVITLAGAPASTRFAAVPEAPEDSARFADSLAWCTMVKPAATLEDRRLATAALLRRMVAR